MASPETDLALARDEKTAASGRAGALVLPLFAATLFTGAALLFWVQPLFAKMVLPLLGGSPAVWNTAIVFFQAALLAGYAYAHLLARALRPAHQMAIHLVVLVAAAAFLPVAVAQGWEPDVGGVPVLWLLALLAVSIGFPFFAVSATAPLLQRWFSRTDHPHAHDPYFLYAASNLGAVIALVGYPLVLEPWLSGRAQSLAWTGTYALLGALIALAGVAMLRRSGAARAEEAPAAAAMPGWRERGRWTLYSAVPSAMLLGVTAHISTDIAAAPLLWVVPLTLYLLTFVIVFARRPVIRHAFAVRLMPFAAVLLVSMFNWREPALLVLPLHLLAFFAIALMCHGELARMRPRAFALTEFYLFVSIGGVLGGMFTALLAPVVFDAVYEYPLAVVAACALLPPARRLLARSDVLLAALILAVLFAGHALAERLLDDGGLKVSAVLAALLALVAFARKTRPVGFALCLGAVLAGSLITMVPEETLWRGRSFFGVYRVAETGDGRFRLFINGTTLHGGQQRLADGSAGPIAYYAEKSPVAEAIRQAQARAGATSIGLVGLGAGSLACYYRPGDDWRFYEIDPLVARIASDGRFFELVPKCTADRPIVLGDARLTLAREPSGRFDMLVIDAFSSDAIPMHLITREAMVMYFDKLRGDGVLVLHVSNLFLELRPVVARLAAELGLAGLVGLGEGGGEEAGAYGDLASVWIALARAPEVLERLGLSERWGPLPEPDGRRAWSDDYSNILEAIRWRGVDAGTGK
jgi:hypothetical protein